MAAIEGTRVTGVRAERRLAGVDAARGVALLGMMAVHVLPGTDPGGGASAAHAVAGGRSSAAFAVLAGLGLGLVTGRWPLGSPRTRVHAAAAIAVRAAAIGTVGLLLGTVDSGVAVILPYYALLFVLAIPLMGRSARTLAAVGLGAAVAVPVLSHLLRGALPAFEGANPTPTGLLADPAGVLTGLLLTGYYPALPWLAYVCAGLLIGRLDLRSPRTAWALLGGGAALALAAALVSRLLLDLGGRAAIAAADSYAPAELERALTLSQYGTTPTSTWWWLAVASPHSATPPDLLHTTGTAVALVGAMLLLARVAGRALRPLAAAGAMTLTLYTTHVLVLATGLLPADREVSYAVQVLAALALATAWLAGRRRGPLEALVAALAAPSRRRAVAGPRDHADLRQNG